ncbi:MAG: hypothetical protein MZV65_48685 [Chromatiales bacterium]|nr:hypothetical protein [Chromatiales bacterium]
MRRAWRRTRSCGRSRTPAWSASAARPSRPTPSWRCPRRPRSHTLVVNGCECEPYLTCDHRVMVEHAGDSSRGIRYADARRAARSARSSASRTTSPTRWPRSARRHAARTDSIAVEAVPTKYPAGLGEDADHVAVRRRDSVGRSCRLSLGIVMNNVGTLAAHRPAAAGRAGADRAGGDGRRARRGAAGRLPRAARHADCASCSSRPARRGGDARQLVLGGPMMGQAVASLDMPGDQGRLRHPGVPPRGHGRSRRPQDLPVHQVRRVRRVPARWASIRRRWACSAARREYERDGRRATTCGDCFECGCCTYVCPSNIPLVQQFRVAKAGAARDGARRVCHEPLTAHRMSTDRSRSAPRRTSRRRAASSRSCATSCAALLPVCAFFVCQYGVSAAGVAARRHR